MAKRKGLMSRLIEGPERSENYARSTLPSNRWQLGWDIFKTNFTKILLLNLILLLFAVPIIAIILFRSLNVSVMADTVPFASFFTYPYVGSLSGYIESIQIRADLQSTVFLPLAAIILAVGLSGVLYILRNMVWTEGVFVGSDFWRGVKNNFLVITGTLVLYSVLLVLGIFSLDFSQYLIAMGNSVVLMTITKVVTYITLGFLTIMMMHMLTMAVTYQLSFFKLIRNAFVLTVSLLPFNIFFALFALVNVLLYMIIPMLGILVFIFIGISGGLLVWTVYSHWIYDKYINDKVPGAKRNRGIYEKPDAETFGSDLSPEGDMTFDTVYLNKRPVKPVTDYDIEIVELPETYGRADLQRLEESKRLMREDSDKYVEDVLSGKIKQESAAEFERYKQTEESQEVAENAQNPDPDAPDDDGEAPANGSESAPANGSESAPENGGSAPRKKGKKQG